jgi:GTP diphosphokinase / guanosine-3',5'-bis(diphosphate) 3'-diphosphatase
MTQFEDVYETVRSNHPGAPDLELLRKAYVFSAIEHKGQTRASGEPYLTHPLEVAAILADMRSDPSCVAVGLLHDVLEDTLTEPERLKENFGPQILHLVEGVTKISQIPFSSTEERQAENFRKLLLAMVDDVRVILVKLADRLHNMRTLQFLPEDRRQRVARETMDIYAPLAGRLGMSRVKNELEELAFQYLEPDGYKELADRVDERRKSADEFIQKIRASCAEKLQVAGIEVTSIEGRIKRLYSIRQKLERQHIQLDQVYDFVALRVLVPTVGDCYAALGVFHNAWRPIPGRIKDFIAMPRPNGYRSLHTSVISEDGQPFEIQIRTTDMHRVAEEGIAAHWKYKEGRAGVDKDDQAFAWLRQVLEWQHEVQDPHEFLASLKLDLYPEEVYCFTPKGLVKTLPRNATPLDFAYAVHTEVGHQCVGVRVNGKMVPLRYQLQNGDIVEVLTSPGHKPSRDWLSLVVTNSARSKIRRYLNNAERQQAVEIGRKHLERELKRYDLTLKRAFPEAAKGNALAQQLGVGSHVDDIYAAIGYGKLPIRQALTMLVPADSLEAPPPERRRPIADAVKRLFRLEGDQIRVRGTDDLLIYRAKCCNPIMGEPIVGYITRGRGISVHAQACPNVRNLTYAAERRIDVEWESTGEAAYEVDIAVKVEDRPGLLAGITAVIAGMQADIRNAEARTFDDRSAAIEFTLKVKDLKHLERVVRSVKGVGGVLGVERQGLRH